MRLDFVNGELLTVFFSLLLFCFGVAGKYTKHERDGALLCLLDHRAVFAV
jgi:hypothetical protein